MPASPSPWPGEPSRRPCGLRAVGAVAGLFVLTGPVAADEPSSPAGDGGFVTVGAACPRLQLECADGRVATRWDMGGLARDLPSGRGPWSLLETVEPAAVVDRIDGAGLHLDEPGRFGQRGASWTQNAVLLDGVDVTDPLRGGTTLLLPDVETLQSIEATSALGSAEYAAPGTTLSLASRAPTAAWRGVAQAYGAGSGL